MSHLFANSTVGTPSPVAALPATPTCSSSSFFHRLGASKLTYEGKEVKERAFAAVVSVATGASREDVTSGGGSPVLAFLVDVVDDDRSHRSLEIHLRCAHGRSLVGEPTIRDAQRADAATAVTHPRHVAKAFLACNIPQLQPDDVAILTADDLQRKVGTYDDCQPKASGSVSRHCRGWAWGAGRAEAAGGRGERVRGVLCAVLSASEALSLVSRAWVWVRSLPTEAHRLSFGNFR